MSHKNLFFFFFCICLNSFGQKQANIWYFGNGAGLDFNNGCTPNVLTNGKIDGFEGCATISDKTSGQLLFYTNSDSVWNRNHLVMPNGHLVNSGSTITQVIIIQKPSFDSIYYIVTSEVQAFSGQGLQFHQVDMTLNGGLGGLTFKDSLLYLSPVTEKLTATRHSNGTDIWLIGHKYNSNQYLAFQISSSGINPVPVISQIGKIHGDPSSADPIGEIKISPDGKKLAAVTLVHPDIELFDFDNSTGLLSNVITLPETGGYDVLGNASGLYGCSFSSNSSKLYISTWQSPTHGVSAKIIQFDISSNDSATINNSRTNIFTSVSKNFYSLKLAPDRKIYVGQNTNINYLGVINSPDSAGFNCNYVDNGIYLNGKFSGWGLNNLMEYGNYCSVTGTNENETKKLKVKFFPNPFSESATLEFENPNNENHSLNVYNYLGQLMFSIKNINTKNIKIEKKNLANGIYFIQLTKNEQVLFSEKFIIE